MTVSLPARARMWLEEADKLLGGSHLLAILSQIGEVKFTGSYAYDLMLGADIDLYVTVPADLAKDAALSALHQLIEQNYWNGYLFYDFAEHSSIHHPGFPKSYYVGLKTDHAGHRWKVDIWFGEDEALNHDNGWIEAVLTDANRVVILELKQARNDGKIQADSHAIYSAVLRHNVTNLDEFRAWQKQAGFGRATQN